jgi:hypothetical protein
MGIAIPYIPEEIRRIVFVMEIQRNFCEKRTEFLADFFSG